MNVLIKSSIILLVLDSIFIYINAGLFSSQIKEVQGSPLEINLVGGVLSYVFLIFGLNYFILREHRGVTDAFILGAVLYGVYETTTYALLKKWKIQTVFIDTIWGGVLYAMTTYLTINL
jgi:uncharacterized membrane protein